jgi:hypothetical protein
MEPFPKPTGFWERLSIILKIYRKVQGFSRFSQNIQGIPQKNIFRYNMHRLIPYEKADTPYYGFKENRVCRKKLP